MKLLKKYYACPERFHFDPTVLAHVFTIRHHLPCYLYFLILITSMSENYRHTGDINEPRKSQENSWTRRN